MTVHSLSRIYFDDVRKKVLRLQRDYKVAKSRITKLVCAKLRSGKSFGSRDRQWSSPEHLVQIFGIASWLGDTEENARLTRVTKRPTAGGPQMPGDYGVYSPAGYWSHCTPAMKRTLAESLSVFSSRWIRRRVRRVRSHLHEMKLVIHECNDVLCYFGNTYMGNNI